MTKKPETPTAVANAVEVPSVLSEGHPQGASGNGTLRDRITAVNPLASQKLVDGVVSEVKAMHEAFVTIPQIGAYRTADHRYYWNGKGPLPSVTSILSVLDKPAVVQWAKRITAEGAVNRQEQVRSLLLNPDKEYVANVLYGFQKDEVDIPPSREQVLSVGPVGSDARKDSLVRWLARLPDYIKDESGKLGSGVHLLADMASRASESDSEAFQVSDLEKPYLAAFLSFLTWLREHGGEIISSEKMVWALDGYAGTYDNLIRFTCDCHQGLWLTDTKTRKGATYPEDALQLIAYGYADQIIVEGSPDPYPMPRIDRYGILHLRPDLYTEANSEPYAIGWRLIEYPLIESDYRAFLGALELYRWKQEGRYTKSKLRST